MPRPIITLTTDFGSRDSYVAEVKGVILSICPEATIVDVSHEIDKFNIRMGAYVLASASKYSPKGTIHMAVVDPSVGTKREAVIVETRNAYFVGPDNGILSLAVKDQGIVQINEIANRSLMLSRVSSTFHGRDVFAPAVAHLASGIEPSEFGPLIREISMPSFAKVVRREDMLIGEIIHVDGFGNIVTNIGEKEIERMEIEENVLIKIGDSELGLRVSKAYAEAEIHEPLAVIGSHNFLEISVYQGNAAKIFGVSSGDRITVCHP